MPSSPPPGGPPSAGRGGSEQAGRAALVRGAITGGWRRRLGRQEPADRQLPVHRLARCRRTMAAILPKTDRMITKYTNSTAHRKAGCRSKSPAPSYISTVTCATQKKATRLKNKQSNYSFTLSRELPGSRFGVLHSNASNAPPPPLTLTSRLAYPKLTLA